MTIYIKKEIRNNLQKGFLVKAAELLEQQEEEQEEKEYEEVVEELREFRGDAVSFGDKINRRIFPVD